MSKGQEVARKMGKEIVLLFGSRPALLTQLAHPLVAQGARDHSSYREDPFGRLRKTFEFAMTMIFGTDQEKQALIDHVNMLHRRVRGVSNDPDMPPQRYSALDPELLFWVYVTLMNTAVVTYETFVAKLSHKEKDAQYQFSIPWAMKLGIPEILFPKHYSAIPRYINAMIELGEVKVTERTRTEVTDIILHPPILPHAVYGALNLNVITAGLLHSTLRQQYGLVFCKHEQMIFDAFRWLVRSALPWTPKLLRTNPYSYKT